MTHLSWNPKLPEVYQIEAVSRCNLRCPFCPTGIAGGKYIEDGSTLMDMDLFETIVNRDLAGTEFCELQFRGEPTLHKQFDKMVKLLKTQVRVGFSTHGGLLHLPHILRAALDSDYVTISMEAATKERYEELRVGGKFERLIENIDLLCREKRFLILPHIDLQLIEFEGYKEHVKLLEDMCLANNWDVSIRTIQDTFQNQYEKNFTIQSKDLCLNPWMSVSVQCDGDVVPCCMSFGKDIVYGNLREASLETIWNESPVVQEFRRMHMEQESIPMCDNCYARSPTFLHRDLFKRFKNL